MIVVEAFLSSLFEVVLDKLVVTPLLEYARRLKVDTTPLQDWKTTLLQIKSVLHDAEQKQIQDDAVMGGPQTSNSKVRKLIPSFHHSSFNKKICKKMKTITKELDAIVKQKTVLGLREVFGEGPSDHRRDRHEGVSSVNQERRTTCLVTESEVYGRGADKEKIMELLLSDEVGTAREVQVIPIVESVSGRSSDSDDLQLLQQSLQKKLKRKRFFLVLDDIWIENPNTWSDLQAPLKDGAAGSVIMVTTRSKSVASIMCTTPIQPLSELSEEDCRSLFAHIAFVNITPDARQNLEPIGRKIITKCKGLPLAVKTLAGLLRCNQDDKAWKKMLNDEIWDLPPQKSSILPALRLSYHYLPSKLKQCFAYCSIFPKNYEFNKEELILLWVAQGFLGGLKRGETIKDVGQTCFDDLLSRNFCLRLDVEKQDNISERTRHISYIREEFDVSKRFDALRKTNKLRTFLPSSMLLNLQSLVLSNCRGLTELPIEIVKLINLLHLDISRTNIQQMPPGINRLKDLQRLTTFVVGEHGCARVKELGDLSHLQGSLSILNLQNVPVNGNDALEANLKEKEDLDALVFTWDPNAINSDLENQTRVLENLQPHNKVKRLSIECFYGAKFPIWLGNPSFMNLVFLRLKDCKSCSSLPPLGQLRSLKDLYIVKMDRVQKVGAELYGNNGCGSSSIKPFGSLAILWFQEMLEWEEWVCSEVEFPCLKELHIVKCPKLKGIYLTPSICELMLNKCDDVMVRSVGSLTSLTSLGLSDVCKIPVELGLLHSLGELSVYGCSELEELPTILHNLTSLKHLEIYPDDSLSSFTDIGLPPVLETLGIGRWPFLEYLPEGMMQNNTTLQHLHILECVPEDMTHNYYASLAHLVIEESCDSFTPFPLAFFTKLEILYIRSHENLESLYIPDGPHHVDLTSLQVIYIDNCPNLVAFPQGGLPTPNLRYLTIIKCEKLKSLPQGMQTLLTSLEQLTVCYCPEIDSFPEGGLPSNLSSLYIWDCYKLMACEMKQGLQTLSFLTWLSVKGSKEERLESFPEEWLLPSTLPSLEIGCFPKLKSLDNMGLQHLTSLERLTIEECNELDSFPKQGLPSSLSRLYIRKCPRLKIECQRDKGKEWPKISRIPCIVLEDVM
ncbi:putative disease resistance RPP13-like protein 1 [Vitis vinifera]|uniref:Putative disease resistance RPP13-like protein 1 n=1 Tax=Vitis vinifera TaxID=29760 RepID=A0A438IUM4_VITVI|nr:putative disease resistance RPP13-like protein 1 [Vitis vinifera]